MASRLFGNAADDSSISVTLNDNSTITAGGGSQPDNDSTTSATTSVTLNGTSTLTANNFTFTNNTGNSARPDARRRNHYRQRKHPARQHLYALVL